MSEREEPFILDLMDALKRSVAEAEESRKSVRHFQPGGPAHVALWDAINEVVVASGGSSSCTRVARQLAVAKVEEALRALIREAKQ